MTDLTFTCGGGPGQAVLILAEEGEYDAGDKEARQAATAAELAEALDDFYGFDITPYIHSHGVIDGDNVESLLRNMGEGGQEKVPET